MTSHNDRRPAPRRLLALHDEECYKLLGQAYQRAKATEDAERDADVMGLGDNRRPVLPKSKPPVVDNGNSGGGGAQPTNSFLEVSSSDDDENDENGDAEGTKGDNKDADFSSSESSEDSSSSGEEEEDDGTSNNNIRDHQLATVSEEDDDEQHNNAPLPLLMPNVDTNSHKGRSKTKKAPSSKQQKRQLQAIQQHSNNLPRLNFPLSETDPTNPHHHQPLHLFPAMSLLSKADLHQSNVVSSQARTLQTLSQAVQTPTGYVVVLLLQSGRFAGGVFAKSQCIVHRALQHYTVRRGQGKAQSSQDQKRRAKSMGSQLRRAGEQSLKEDVQQTLIEWNVYISHAALIFIACPKTMRSTLFFVPDNTTFIDDKGGTNGGVTGPVLSKDDDRIRKIPFDAGRPTYESVKIVHQVMLGVEVRSGQDAVTGPSHDGHNSDDDDYNKAVIAHRNESSQQERVDGDKNKNNNKETEKKRIVIDRPLTPLHEASRDGNLVVLLNLLHQISQTNETVNNEDDEEKEEENKAKPRGLRDAVNQRAGYDWMTPLHCAAAATTTTTTATSSVVDNVAVDPASAAKCVSTLLVQGRADPTLLDARGRPPYFLANHDKVRDAFRKARAELGEQYCDWDSGAKVGPPLTDDDVAARKERELEKKKRKKARQKEKKAKDDAQAQVLEERRKAEEEAQRQAMEAKRIRDGLPSATGGGGVTGSNVCDYCQKKCVGKKRQQMFVRLEYKYCSTDCVNTHKRELMAKAAMARLGGGGN